MKAWTGKNDRREGVLRWRTRTIEAARTSLGIVEAQTPPGYVHLHSFYGRDHGSGARYSVTLVMIHNDSREPELLPKDARDHWDLTGLDET